jgi:hypothetical protein
MNAYSYLLVELYGDVACVRLVRTRLEEMELLEMGDELVHLASLQGKLILLLGPERPDFLYSVFLAKLISVRNATRRRGGELVLCQVNPITYTVFEACRLDRAFVFCPTLDEALDFWQNQPAHATAPVS